MNFQVFCQIPFGRKWFSTFRAELVCPINLFFVMYLDLFDEVPFVWCFVRARWTYVDFLGVSFFLLCFLMWFLCLSFPVKFSWHTSQEKGRLSCSLVLLIDESQDQLPLQKILHIRCKGSPLCFNACIRLIQINWLPNFYSQISPIITFQFNWFLNFHSQYNLRSTRSNELKLC